MSGYVEKICTLNNNFRSTLIDLCFLWTFLYVLMSLFDVLICCFAYRWKLQFESWQRVPPVDGKQRQRYEWVTVFHVMLSYATLSKLCIYQSIMWDELQYVMSSIILSWIHDCFHTLTCIMQVASSQCNVIHPFNSFGFQHSIAHEKLGSLVIKTQLRNWMRKFAKRTTTNMAPMIEQQNCKAILARKVSVLYHIMVVDVSSANNWWHHELIKSTV